MVEITKSVVRAALLVVLILCVSVSTASELSDNAQYTELSERAQSVATQIDELRGELTKLRAKYAAGGSGAAKEIEAAELSMFDLQQQQTTLERKINEVVQQWELDRIGDVEGDATSRAESSVVLAEGDERVATLSSSRTIVQLLAGDDVGRLRQSAAEELRLWEIFTLSTNTYGRLVELSQRYAQTKKESEALEIVSLFDGVEPVVDSLFTLLGEEWARLYDHKVYCYAVALESLGREEVLAEGEQILRDGVAGVESDLDNPYGVAQLYDMQKRAMLRYESCVAQDLGLVGALDSLRGALKSVTARGDVEPFEMVRIVERNFIDYEDVKFSTAPVYKKSSNIPEAKLYPRGRIYRLQLGAYKTPQVPSIFRGAHPLSCDKALGFWTYYTGAFATYAEAEQAQKLCKSKGFNRPEIVVWNDGKRRNYGRQPLPATNGFRVIVEGVEAISPELEAQIKSMCGDVQLSKLGATKYIIATVAIRPKADEVAEMLMASDDNVVCEVIAVE
ncbi:MAG: hypothetical protein R3Y68_02025 [Rikenellaceae bacterium]